MLQAYMEEHLLLNKKILQYIYIYIYTFNVIEQLHVVKLLIHVIKRWIKCVDSFFLPQLLFLRKANAYTKEQTQM